jgi:hypothetical protein
MHDLSFVESDPNETFDPCHYGNHLGFCEHCSHATGVAKIWMAH